jgi:hypothetical protein
MIYVKRYRNKPVIREAIILGWDTWSEVCEFVSDISFGGGVYLDDKTKKPLQEGHISNTMGLWLNTLESRMLAQQGDYIVKGVEGKFYACKPSIFERIYEAVGVEKENDTFDNILKKYNLSSDLVPEELCRRYRELLDKIIDEQKRRGE